MAMTMIALRACILISIASILVPSSTASQSCSDARGCAGNSYTSGFLPHLQNLPLRRPQPTPPGLNRKFENAGTPSKPRQRSGSVHQLMIVTSLPNTDGGHRFARSCLIQGVAPENMLYDVSPLSFVDQVVGEGDVVFIAGDEYGDVIETLSKFRSQPSPIFVPKTVCSDCPPFGALIYANTLQEVLKTGSFSSWIDVLNSLRSDENAQIDEEHSIMQELTSHGDLYTGTVRFHQPFDDVDDLRLIDEATQTLPCFFRGVGPGEGQVDQIGNYIPNAWSDSRGCIACEEWKLTGEEQQRFLDVYITVDAASPFLSKVLEDLSNQTYPKNKMSVSVVVLDGEKSALNRKIVADWISKVESSYDDISLLPTSDYVEGFRHVVAKALQSNSRLFVMHSHVRLVTPSALIKLVNLDYNVIAPKLSREGKYWSNFWGAASGFDLEPVPKALEVVTKELGYLRSPDYFEIVERKQLGVWTVPLVNSAIMFHQRVLQELADAMDAMMHAVQENPRFGDWFTIQSALCLHLRSKGIFSRVTNLFELGHLINAEDYDATRAHPDLFLVTANPIEWEQEYLNELYDKFAEYADVPNCHDVYQVPLFSPKFARELIEECEFFGQWSGGDHADERLDGGYEPVPTQDIHMQQIGFKKAWKHILLKYLSPITNYHFIGYHMEAKHSLDFVVRYNPKKQSFLKPHHDASTVTLNLALNQGGVDYEGGGTHFIRQNCTYKDAPPGWGAIFPGRLTHYHEGLKTTKGTRYILVSFIDQM